MNTKALSATLLLIALTPLVAPAQQASPSPAEVKPETITATAPPHSVGNVVVNVLGEVNYPGRITLPGDSTILDAIATVGGWSEKANLSKVTCIHKFLDSHKQRVEVVDLKSVLKGEAPAFTLENGDTIVVGEAIY